jgi:hypothetical protein
MQLERGDAVVTPQSAGETTCVNLALEQFIRASILSNALYKNIFTRFCRLAAEEFDIEIGPGYTINCMAMAGVQAEVTKTKNF